MPIANTASLLRSFSTESVQKRSLGVTNHGYNIQRPLRDQGGFTPLLRGVQISLAVVGFILDLAKRVSAWAFAARILRMPLIPTLGRENAPQTAP
jgi:hypothetical protein